MTEDELAGNIGEAIRRAGFARIPTSALLNALPSAEEQPFKLAAMVRAFAEARGWAHRHEGPSFIVFYPPGSEPPKR